MRHRQGACTCVAQASRKGEHYRRAMTQQHSLSTPAVIHAQPLILQRQRSGGGELLPGGARLSAACAPTTLHLLAQLSACLLVWLPAA